MAAYVKYQIGTEVLLEAANSATDSWRLILSNTAPNVATSTTAASATELRKPLPSSSSRRPK